MKKLIKNTSWWLSAILIGIILGLGLGIVKAWTEPASSPPEGNLAAPINVGSTGQFKSGGLLLNSGGATNGLIVEYGNVGIGTTNPGTSKLKVAGLIESSSNGFKFPDGTIQTTAGGAGGKDIAISTGIVGHGGTIPLPYYSDGTQASIAECVASADQRGSGFSCGDACYAYKSGGSYYVFCLCYGRTTDYPQSAQYMIVCVR